MSVHQFVAHFLRKEGYNDTLKAFENEHGKPIPAELPHQEDLSDIINDRLKYLSIEEKPQSSHEILLSEELKELKRAQFKEWSAPYPRAAKELSSVKELAVASAVFEKDGKKYGIFASAKMELSVMDLDLDSGELVVSVPRVIGPVVVRRLQVVGTPQQVDCRDGGGFMEQKDYLVSVGWDLLVKVHELSDTSLEEAFEPYTISNRGLCMDACVYQDQLVILLGKSEMTLMDVLTVKEGKVELAFKIALNDAEFSAAGFSPHAIKIYNGGPVPLVAVGTSHEPYMRLVLVSLKEFGKEGDSIRRNQIITNINSMSPQDKFSQALITWRPDGSGVWVFGEDGTVRGIDLLKEEVAVELKKCQNRIKSFGEYKDSLLVCDTNREVVLWTHEQK
ncbi:hypothetical protein CXQ85_003708 [Candidozyma haemuli]|uniref:LisH domain-containing protein n=1 Tax=Candidozyma haemuli TaxID=45357 RepID=A0A2V1AP61_9ASCO|nr:hypothetical protein CXQ85_003708 [[Candida] haemuloni]PVH19850.1 hypothetical protein CXQ85_003708 [[Candida] haemuloni]